MSKEKLVKALKPFMSKQMEEYVSDRPDDTMVRLEISGRNGFGLQLTLAELRELWEEYNMAIKPSMTNEEILAIEFEPMGFNSKLTIKEYLLKLLRTLWRQGDRFSGKRPFGNSGWQYDVYEPLIKHGIIDGKIDRDGYIEECDDIAAEKLVLELIAFL